MSFAFCAQSRVNPPSRFDSYGPSPLPLRAPLVSHESTARSPLRAHHHQRSSWAIPSFRKAAVEPKNQSFLETKTNHSALGFLEGVTLQSG
jgi:hypothetical protein